MGESAPLPRLKIESLQDLFHQEKEIVERIKHFPNGGNLFVTHPFLLLGDVGVDLADQVRAELVRQDPYLSGLSATSYNALKTSTGTQRTRFHVRGLFRKETQP